MSFTAPAVLLALLAVPAIWWLLRLTPPRPRSETFPPTRLLIEIARKEETPAQTPWWLTALRLSLASVVILALADPVLRPTAEEAPGDGPLLIVIDNGWAAAKRWPAIRETALAIVRLAERADRPVGLLATAEAPDQIMPPSDPLNVAARIEALAPRPYGPDYAALMPVLGTMMTSARFGGAAWLSDGLGGPGTEALAAVLADAVDGPVRIYADRDAALYGLAPPTGDAAALTVPVIRRDATVPTTGIVTARDLRDRIIAQAPFAFAAGALTADAVFEVPTELRNEIVRVEVGGEATAGAVQLLDERYRRRTFGIIVGTPSDQPLLSADYYLTRALAPFADVRPADPDLARAITGLTGGGVASIILADIGTLPPEAEAELAAWVEAGGTLIRFAGPRLAAAEPTLVPVRLRQGGRTLGGALSWERPQPLGEFPRTSPFFGLAVPNDVVVERQVLAEPDEGLAERTWAVLADGTPLVTAVTNGQGLLVLFHVTGDTSWSNLPLSGVFVQMLRRIAALSSAAGGERGAGAMALPPYRVLDGEGRFVEPGAAAEPIPAGPTEVVVGAAHPPGLYGNDEGFRALSLLGEGATLPPLDVASAGGATLSPYPDAAPFELRPWLLALALALLLLDAVAVLWLGGALRARRASAAGLMLALCATLLAPAAQDARAQGALTPADEFALRAANRTSLAYVITGSPASDNISRAGLAGLSVVLAQRTSFVPGDPIGVDIATDELAFFPILYWRIDPAAPMPTPDAIGRIDAFMRSGGVILFDTADELVRATPGLTDTTPAATRLREMLATLDLPPLEPVPADHVLTKTFYLLTEFPGRHIGGQLWVEALPAGTEPIQGRPARPTDGVSPILITSNDLAAAWAIDERGAFLFPTDGTDTRQREMAFRVGINIVMYALTGNYKTDQVHVPALLERLGQ